MKASVFLFHVLMCCSLYLCGQQFSHHQITLPAEVKTSELSGVYIDRDGFIWLSAGKDLFRYDGINFKQIPADSNYIPDDKISVLYHDRHHKLWVGWESGTISEVKRAGLFSYCPPEGNPSVPIVKWTEDSYGQLWMATYGEGVYVKDSNGRWHNFNHDDGLPSLEVYDMERWGNHIMLATDQGLVQASFENRRKKLRILNQDQGLADQIVKSIEVDKDGLWIAYYESTIDLMRKDGSIERFQAPAVLDAYKLVKAGNLSWWLSESGNLYHAQNNKGWQLLNLFEGRKARIQDIVKDNEGHLWIVGSRGLQMLDQWRKLYQGGERVSAICQQGHSLWYASEGNLFHVDLLTHQEDLLWQGDEPVLSLYLDARQRLWAGTFNAGVKVYDQKTNKLKVLNEAKGLVNNNVLSINGNAEGVWLGTLGGASFYPIDDQQLKHPVNFGGEGGVGLQYIYAVAVSDLGEVYLGTDGDGVLRKRGDHFVPLLEGQSSGVVLDLCVDKKGSLWWITPNGRLLSWSAAGQVDSIPAWQHETEKFSGIEAAPNGDILVFYEAGILRWSPAREAWINYGKAYGLENLQPELHAQHLDPQAGLFIGTATGINFLNLDLLPELSKPSTFFDGPELFFKPTHKSRFQSHDNHLTFNYVGRWFTDPQAVRYRIKLEGYDLEWTTSQNTQTTYPRLPPGDYTFKVVAGVNGYFPAEQMKQYHFSIATPWYQRWYVIAGAILVLAAWAALYIRNRFKQVKYREQQEQDRIRAQYEAIKSQVNPHFLFNSFNTLMALIEDDREEARDYLTDLSDFFRNILQYREVDLYHLKDELSIIQTYLSLQKKRFGENVRVDICLSKDELNTKIPPLTLQLLLENAFKHNVISRHKPLEARIFVEDGYLVVWNALQERQNPDKSTGYGLESIRKKYSFYEKKPVKIARDQDQYAVYLPLLT